MPSDGQPLDLFGVHAGRQALLARAAHPRFAAWWERFLAGRAAELEAPAWPEAGPTVEARHARANAAAGRMESLAFAAALTGDDRLGRHAAALLRAVSEDPEAWMSPGHREHYPELDADLLVAERSKRVAATLSWAAPWVSDADRGAALDALRLRGAGLIYRDSGRGAWWADGYNSNWCAVLNSGLGLAALALAGEDPDTAGLWLERARDAIRRILDLSAEEGAGVEGLSYWVYCFRSCLDMAEALRCAGDGELMAHPFWARAVEFPLHLALPDLSGWSNFGDCGYPGLGGSHLFYALASRAGDRRAQWLAQRIVGEHPEARLSYWDLLFCDPDLPEEPPAAMPSCRLFPSVHLASLRSGWDPDAVHFVVKGGSNAWSHCHLDLNSFILSARGERLAVDPGPWSYTKDYWTSVEPPVSTAWHNTLTVDGGDQRQPPRYRMSFDLAEGGDAYCRLEGFTDSETFASVRGNATTAYADTLERFVRHVVYLKPDAFLLFDDVRVRDARTQRHLQWLLHSELPMVEEGSGIRIRGERSELHVVPLLPRDGASKFLPDRPARGKGGKEQPIHCWALRPRWHHIWNVSPGRSPYPHWHPQSGPRLFGTDYPFLVLLQVTRAGEAPRWSAEVLADGDVPGVRLTAGDREVRVVLPEGGSADAVPLVRSDRGGE